MTPSITQKKKNKPKHGNQRDALKSGGIMDENSKSFQAKTQNIFLIAELRTKENPNARKLYV